MSKKYLPKSKFKKMEYLEYKDKLEPEDLAWIEQFYDEYYNDGGYFMPEDKMIIKDEEMRKEARKNHNSLKRDAFEVASKTAQLDELSENKEFMNEMSDEHDWRYAYKVGGYELAVKTIYQQTIYNLQNANINPETTLTRFYSKMEKLRKEFNLERRKNKK